VAIMTRRLLLITSVVLVSAVCVSQALGASTVRKLKISSISPVKGKFLNVLKGASMGVLGSEKDYYFVVDTKSGSDPTSIAPQLLTTVTSPNVLGVRGIPSLGTSDKLYMTGHLASYGPTSGRRSRLVRATSPKA
jgi:hypothetical protein